MIQQTTFLGMPLRTKKHRRRLVVGFSLFMAMLTLPLLWRVHALPAIILVQTLNLAGILGGIRAGGPVKAFSDSMVPVNQSGVQTLNLSGRKEDRLWEPLDEREKMERNEAHYTAYRILRWTFCVGAVLYWAGMVWAIEWTRSRSPILLWVLLIFVLSLPQCVVLWTETEQPAGELAEVEAGAR